MKVNVKILQGAECNVDIISADSVDHLKHLVQVQLNISPSNQRLLHKGKTLQDGTLLEEYNLREGDKLHLVVKKEASPVKSSVSTGCIETQTETPVRVVLEREMTRILRSHYSSDTEVRKVVSVFIKNIDKKLSALSLDDIERICARWNTDQNRDIECPYSDRNKYSEASNRWSHYFNSIEKAESAYVGCELDSSCSSCHDDVIRSDLAPFKSGITQDMMEAAAKVPRVTKYQIIRGKLYRSEDCMFPFRCAGIEHFLLELAPSLPDLEILINTRDWPQIHRATSPPLPVLSFSKTAENYDIMYPAWSFWCGGPAISLYPSGLGRWDQHRESLAKAARQTPWQSKQDLAMFRGSRTSSERDPLVRLSRVCPHMVDARYTKNQAWKSVKDSLGMEPAGEVSLESHCDYKYLFNYRGVAASFRLKHLFLCRSLVFHVGEEWLEFFYPAMKAWIHYIPVPSSAREEELYGLIEFARDNPEISTKIAERGAKFIEDHLRLSDVSCYWDKLLRSYSELIKYKVTRDPRLNIVKS